MCQVIRSEILAFPDVERTDDGSLLRMCFIMVEHANPADGLLFCLAVLPNHCL